MYDEESINAYPETINFLNIDQRHELFISVYLRELYIHKITRLPSKLYKSNFGVKSYFLGKEGNKNARINLLLT